MSWFKFELLGAVLQGRFVQVMTEKKALAIQSEQLKCQNEPQDIHLFQQNQDLICP